MTKDFICQTPNWYLRQAPQVNDHVWGDGSVVPCQHGRYFYKVLSVTPLQRFGKDNFLLKVEKYAISINNPDPRLVETTTVWANQLF